MNPTRDLLNALRRADAAEDKLARIAHLCQSADAAGIHGVGTRDIRHILDGATK